MKTPLGSLEETSNVELVCFRNVGQHVVRREWAGRAATAGLPENTRVLHQRESVAVVPEFRFICRK